MRPIRPIGLLLSILVLVVQLGDLRLPASIDIPRLCGNGSHGGGLHGHTDHSGDSSVLLAKTMTSEAGALPLLPLSAATAQSRRPGQFLATLTATDRRDGDGSRAWQAARGPPETIGPMARLS